MAIPGGPKIPSARMRSGTPAGLSGSITGGQGLGEGLRQGGSPQLPTIGKPEHVVRPAKLASLPPTPVGAMLGVLFGNMLGAITGPTRDAAIGAAAYASAEHELGERLKSVQDPPFLPTVFGGLPIAPQPMRRSGAQTL